MENSHHFSVEMLHLWNIAWNGTCGRLHVSYIATFAILQMAISMIATGISLCIAKPQTEFSGQVRK